jgi:hypothetical protein
MSTKISTKREHVTPEIAQTYLDLNTHNRPLNKGYVRELAQELEQGRWLATHQGIAYGTNGVLLDGQHRLAAIVQAGIPADLLVSRDVDPEAFHAIDQHRRRTAGQILTMDGVTTDAPRHAAMARAILQVVEGQHRASNTAASQYALAHADVLALYLPVARRYTPAVGAAFAWADMLGWSGVQEAAERLVEKLWSGPGDPMRALDRRSEGFRKDGQGQQAIATKFSIALNTLRAVHVGQDLTVARIVNHDYAAFKRESDLGLSETSGERAARVAREDQQSPSVSV